MNKVLIKILPYFKYKIFQIIVNYIILSSKLKIDKSYVLHNTSNLHGRNYSSSSPHHLRIISASSPHNHPPNYEKKEILNQKCSLKQFAKTTTGSLRGMFDEMTANKL